MTLPIEPALRASVLASFQCCDGPHSTFPDEAAKVFQRPTLAPYVNHRVAVGANDREICKRGLSAFIAGAQR